MGHIRMMAAAQPFLSGAISKTVNLPLDLLVSIQLRWLVNDLPQISGFSARDAFMLKLILLEAISNVLHHSHAKDLVIKAVHNSQAGALIVSVSDNGCGLDPAIMSDTTIGLNNMRKRATRISTGAKISIQSVPRKGTTVCTELALSPSPMG
jgi:signal transduction histidine kinase